MKCLLIKVRDSRITRMNGALGFEFSFYSIYFDKILTDLIRTDEILWSDALIPDEVDLKHIDKSLEKIPEMQKSLHDENNQNTKFDIEELRTTKTVGSNEVELKTLSTVKENDFHGQKDLKKIPTRYLN